MQRSRPYRPRPTPHFMNLFDIAINLRMYLVQENGPTKLVLEDANQRKYKVQIGSEISCSCGGGKEDHCVHTIYAMVKIFRISEGDPLIWQLSFVDSEISKIIQNRYSARAQQSREENHRQQQRPRDISNLQGDKKPNENRKNVPRMKLEADEMCCVCHEVMKDEENLTFCKHGCGRNLHTDCIEVWVKHKVSVNQKISCPLCRTDWGPNALEELREETKNFKEKQKEMKEQAKRSSKEEPQNDRSFKCYCCKRTLIYEAKLQCIICANVEICKLCYSGKYHEQHEFIMRPSPDKDWEPMFRGPATSYNDEYQRVMRELSTREIQPEDYELLLSLETRQNIISLPKFLALSYERANPPTQQYESLASVQCNFCEMRIEDKSKGLQFKNCEHCIHKACLEDMFRLKKNSCQICSTVIAEGYDRACQIRKLKPNKVLKKKKEFEETKQKILAEIQERVQGPSFGIEGVGIVGSAQDQIDPRTLYGNRQNGAQFKIRQHSKPVQKPPISVKRKGENGQVVEENFLDFNFKLSGKQIVTNSKPSNNDDNQPFQRRGLSQIPQRISDFQMYEEEKQLFPAPTNILPSSNHFNNFGNAGGARDTQQQVKQQRLIKQNTKLKVQKDISEYKSLQFGVAGNGLQTQYQNSDPQFTLQQDDEFEEEEQKQRMVDNMRNKKVKEHLRLKDKERRLLKAKQLQGNAPLSKYYREQINRPDLHPESVLQANALRITSGQKENMSQQSNSVTNGSRRSTRPNQLQQAYQRQDLDESHDHEEYKEFVGDLNMDITQLNRARFRVNSNNEYSLIENAIPNLPDQQMMHPDFVRLQRLGYFE